MSLSFPVKSQHIINKVSWTTYKT